MAKRNKKDLQLSLKLHFWCNICVLWMLNIPKNVFNCWFRTKCTLCDCIYLCILKIHLYTYIYKEKSVYKFSVNKPNQKSIFIFWMHVGYKNLESTLTCDYHYAYLNCLLYCDSFLFITMIYDVYFNIWMTKWTFVFVEYCWDVDSTQIKILQKYYLCVSMCLCI